MVPLTEAITKAPKDYNPEADRAIMLKRLKEENLNAIRKTVMESFALSKEQLTHAAGPVPDMFQRPTIMELKFDPVPGAATLHGDAVYVVNGETTMIEWARANWILEHGTEDGFLAQEVFGKEKTQEFSMWMKVLQDGVQEFDHLNRAEHMKFAADRIAVALDCWKF
jgi:hypothetical protein